MGKKAKVGKQRRDKAYWSAKEIGYRSRASFKLVQLNRKFEFLQKSRVCLDLCAAPGSWMQVAKEHMPVSSVIVGVDLVPIKPIPGCLSQQNDITTDKCRADLKKELQGWKVDVVLHDGAPNVGKSWAHDAYQQSLLTLHSFKLATEFLKKGGTFVTKVFRSKDYQSLMWVLNQFFKRVHSTKPPASRNESAEIFVVCLGYKAPDKIDPRFLDPRHVFSELDAEQAADPATDNPELLNPEKAKRKAPAEGYESGATLLYKKAKASEFIMDDKPIHVLNNFYEIVLDEKRIADHPKTTGEVKECCKDLKVLGMKELRLLKKWRESLRSDFEKSEKPRAPEISEEVAGADKAGNASDDEEEKEMKNLEKQIETLKDEERRDAKRKRKREMREKRKTAEKIDLKMILPGDEGPVREEEGLFRMKDLKNAREIDGVAEQAPDMVAESDDNDDDDAKTKKAKVQKYSREVKHLDKSGQYYKESDSEGGEGSGDDEGDSDSEREGLGFGENGAEEDEEEDELEFEGDEESVERLNDPSTNPLLIDLDESNRENRRRKRAEMWFDRDAFKGIESDEDAVEEDISAAIKAHEKKGGKITRKRKGGKAESDHESADDVEKSKQGKTQPQKVAKPGKGTDDAGRDEDTSDSDDSDSDFDVADSYRHLKKQAMAKEGDGFEVVATENEKKGKKRKKGAALTPEELAIGQEMIMSKKRKRDMLDAGWNRFMFSDRDADLPDWFVKDEQHFMKPKLDLDQKVVEKYRFVGVSAVIRVRGLWNNRS